MAVIHEDFMRCDCGHADFRKRETVTLPKDLKPRYINEKSLEHPTLENKIEYVCAKCGTIQPI